MAKLLRPATDVDSDSMLAEEATRQTVKVALLLIIGLLSAAAAAACGGAATFVGATAFVVVAVACFLSGLALMPTAVAAACRAASAK